VLMMIGIYALYLNTTGDTDMNFLGIQIKSTNVGVIAFIAGAGLILLSFRRLLTSVERLGRQ